MVLYDTKRQNPIKFVCAVVAMNDVFFYHGLKSRRMGWGRGVMRRMLLEGYLYSTHSKGQDKNN